MLGLVVLAVVSDLVTAAASGGLGLSALAVTGIVLKAIAFLGITVGLGHRLSGPIVRLVVRTGQHGILLVFGLAICFALAFVAETIGLAGIIGAFRLRPPLPALLRDDVSQGEPAGRRGGSLAHAARADRHGLSGMSGSSPRTSRPGWRRCSCEGQTRS
jgi:hypothetical protein